MSDIGDFLAEICELMGIKFTMPERFVSHRWLSVYDVAVSTYRLMDAFKVLYYAFVSKDLKVSYTSIVVDIYKRWKVSQEARDKIRAI